LIGCDYGEMRAQQIPKKSSKLEVEIFSDRWLIEMRFQCFLTFAVFDNRKTELVSASKHLPCIADGECVRVSGIVYQSLNITTSGFGDYLDSWGVCGARISL
jgi:hypothetical protein